MKKLFSIVLAIGLFMSGVYGCSTLSAIGTAIGNVAQKICDFIQAEASQAQSASSFIGTVASLIKVNGVSIDATTAAATFMAVYNAASTGTCVAAAYQAASTTKGFRVANPIPDISLLRLRVGK